MWDNFFLQQCIMVRVMLETPIGINWSQKVLDFYHFGEILDLFRGGNFNFLTTVYLNMPIEAFGL